MKVRIVVHYAGNEYYGSWYAADNISVVVDSVQNAVQCGESFQLELISGSYIVFGNTAVKACVILVEKSSE